jgi:hypothetical protein
MVLRLPAAWAILLTLLSFGYGSDKKPTRTPLPSQGVVPDEPSCEDC